MEEWTGGFIGAQVSFQIDNEAQVTVDDLREWCEEVGLAEEYLPAPTFGVDALRVAIKKLRTTRFDVTREGVTARVELECKECTRDRFTVIYKLTYEWPHAQPETAGHIRYNRPDRNEYGNVPGTDSIEHWFPDTLPDDERDQLEAAIKGVLAAARHYRDYLHAGRLRIFVRNVTLGGDALVLDPPGVYWVPDARTVATVRALIERIGGSVKVLWVANIGEHRDMLSDELNAQIRRDAGSLRAMLNDATSRSHGGPLMSTRRKSLRNDYLGLVARARRLSTLIGRPIGTDARNQVNALRDEFIDILGGR